MLRNATYLKRSEPFPFGMPVSEMIGGVITLQPPALSWHHDLAGAGHEAQQCD